MNIVIVVVAGLVTVLITALAVAAVVAAQLRRHQVVEREATVRAAVETVVDLAGDKLGDHLAAGSRELEVRGHQLDTRFVEMAAELRRVTDLASSLQRERSEQHGQLLAGLAETTRSTASLAESAQGLREVLASPKARGQWGERMADDVLRTAGMVEGITYRKQTAIAGGSIPDVTFLLPGGRELHMDVKFPVDNFLRHLEASSDAERERAAAAFLKDVRNRVKELAGRDYIQSGSTLDEVLLFIPNESVWAFIHERDPQLIDVALRRKVVLCSPVTLFAVLAVIRQAVEQVRLERTSDEILECLAGFAQQWGKFTEALDKATRQFDTAHRGLGELTGPRRRQLERHLDRIEDLRARRGLPDPVIAYGDGEGEVLRRAAGEVHPLTGRGVISPAEVPDRPR
ncbi:hypothetical protein BH24ACT3_BH24ACT3_16690 [soil metagenome]